MNVCSPVQKTTHLGFHLPQRLGVSTDHKENVTSQGYSTTAECSSDPVPHLLRWSEGHSKKKRGFSHHPNSGLFRAGHCGATPQDSSLRSCVTEQGYRAQARTATMPTDVISSRWLSLSGPQFPHWKNVSGKRVYCLTGLLEGFAKFMLRRGQGSLRCAVTAQPRGHGTCQAWASVATVRDTQFPRRRPCSTLALRFLLEKFLFVLRSFGIPILGQLKEKLARGKLAWARAAEDLLITPTSGKSFYGQGGEASASLGHPRNRTRASRAQPPSTHTARQSRPESLEAIIHRLGRFALRNENTVNKGGLLQTQEGLRQTEEMIFILCGL